MLEFQWDDFSWSAKARLIGWTGYRNRDPLRGPIEQGDAFDDWVTVTFAPEGRDNSPLTAAELASVQWVLDWDAQIASAALQGILVAYPNLQRSYGYEGAEAETYMPDVSSVDGFATLIGLCHVFVHPLIKDGLPYIGYEFQCSWDEEHGLGVLMHGTRVVEVGGADTAVLLWIAEQDAGIES